MGKRGPKPKAKVEEPVIETVTEPVASEVADMTGGVDGTTEAPTVVAHEPKSPAPAPKAYVYPPDVEESRKVLGLPLDESQQFFESPEGYIVIGEKGRGRVWCRQANNRQGSWINPMR